MKLRPEHTGLRMDRAIAECLSELGQNVSVSEIKKALKDGRIKVNGRLCAPGARVQVDDAFHLDDFVPKNEWVIKPAPQLLSRTSILYEDDEWLALDKPSGVHTVPLKNLEEDTLLGAAIAQDIRIANSGPGLEGGALHRLDFGTSGVVLFAKDPAGRARVRKAFEKHEIIKTYLAVVCDDFSVWNDERTVDLALNTSKKRVRTDAEGLVSITHFSPLERHESGRTLVKATTNYGRRHQVRVHLASSGTPILGDEVYGQAHSAGRLALHASSLTLPFGLNIRAPMPQDFKGYLK